MKTIYTIAAAIVAVIIIIAGVFAYISLSTPAASPSPSSNPTTTPTQTVESTTTPSATPGPAIIHGAGATFPAPFINATVYYYQTNIQTNVQIDYSGVGSGQGVQSFTSKTVDFAGSDAPLTDSQRQAAPNALHIL